MALKKILEYTFDKSVGDCLPTISPTMSMTTEDEAISSTETRRTISIDETLFPTHIHFTDMTSLLTVDFVKIDSKVNSMMNMFRGCSNLTSVNFSGCDASGVTTMQNMFIYASKITSINLSGLKFTKLTNMQSAFFGCSLLETVNFSDFNSNTVTTMNQLFYNCASLSKLDLSSFDTHLVTNMGFMFFGCSKLTTLDLSNFNTTRVTNMNAMFRECSSLRFLKISSFDTGKVTTMAEMFRDCSSLEELDLSNFNVTKVQQIQSMFNQCVNLKSINLSSFKTSEATNMSGMFRNCERLTSLDLSAFETSKVTDFSMMFGACKTLTSLDLSNFKSDVVSNINYMFQNTSLLTSIDISNFKVLSTTTTTNAFANTYELKDVGMLYCDNETINIMASQLNSNVTGNRSFNIYYLEADESELIAQSNITFKKYITHSTMQLPPHIQLYSLPNGVKDELDLKTGILTRNVGHIILDDSYEYSETIYNTTKENTIIMQWYDGVNSAVPNIKNSSVILCDRLPNREALGTDVEAIDCHGTSSVLHFNISKDKLKGYESTFNGVKKYLGDNPLSVYYQLETPTTEKIILNYNNSCDYAIKLPTGAVDKYDVVNSLYTQNVNSILLDGSNSWESLEDLGTTIKFTAIGSSVGIDNLNMKGSGGLYCDNGMFPNINDDSDVEHCRVDKEGNKFYFFVNRTRLMSPDLIGWQYWLISNSFTLYYERNESETYSKLYEELDPTQASWEMLDCMRGGEIAHDTNGTNGITLYPTMEYVAPSINNFNISMLEPTTEYTIYAKNTNSNQTLSLGGVAHRFTDGSKYLSGKTQWVTFNGCDTVDKVVIIKGDTTKDYVPYFTGIQSVKMPVLTTRGKNLFNKSNIIVDGYIISDGRVITQLNDNRNATDYIEVLPDTMYTMSGVKNSGIGGGNTTQYVAFYDKNKKYLTYAHVNVTSDKFSITTSSETIYIRMSVRNADIDRLQIEKGSVPTSYELHTSNILTCNEEVALRAVGDVKDELNLVTGELIQRVGEIVLDGSENWQLREFNQTNTECVIFSMDINDKLNYWHYKCDKFKYIGIDIIKVNNIEGIYAGGKPHNFFINVSKTKASTVEEFKNWLSNNNVTVQYELAEPIVKTVNLQYNIGAYEKLYRAISRTPSDIVHVQASSDSLPPLLELECSTASASTENYATIENNIRFDGIDKAALKGNTRKNEVIKNEEKTVIMTSSATTNSTINYSINRLENNTTYWFSVDVVTNTCVGTSSTATSSIIYIANGEPFRDYTQLKNANGEGLLAGATGRYFAKVITGTNITNKKQVLFYLGRQIGAGTIIFKNPFICKSVTGEELPPYFEGLGAVKMPILKTTGKNLFYNTLEYGDFNTSTGISGNTPTSIIIRTKEYNEIFPNKTYRITVFNAPSNLSNFGVYEYDNDFNCIKRTDSNVFTTNVNTKYVKFRFRKSNSSAFTEEELAALSCMITVGDTIPDTYEDCKLNTLSYNEEVTLRAVGEVRDELNLLTGGFTQRIQERVLDGSESYNVSPNATDGYSHFTTQIEDISNIPHILCTDRFNLGGDAVYEGKEEGTYYNGNTLVHFTIATSKLSENTVNGFKEWLSKNPVTILYQLATPIAKVIDLAYINENNEELSYNDTTMTNSTNIILNGDTPITPNVIYALPSKNSFYLVNIKTGTRYTLKYPSGTGQISIGNLSYAVTGSSVLFMTPFEITGDKNAIVFSDEDPQDVILVEGDYSNIEVPYFTGIKSVENPVIEVYNKLTTETVQYKATSSVTLRSLPNGVADTLDIITGMLTQMINQRPYEEGDESLTDVWTDGENTIYGLTSPIIRNITFPTPTITSFSTIKVFSNHLIPQLKYRALSSNNFPLDLLQPNKTYTLYATVSNIGSYTLGGTYTGNFFGTTAISLGDVTSKSLIFNSDVGASNVMLIEGDTTKSTVPYFLGILSVEDIIMYIKGYKGEMNSMTLDDDVVLNGFGENRDIIDLTTGILTKKTNQIVLVGTENWIKFDDVNITDEYVLFRLNIPDLEASSVLGLKCDKFSHVYAHQQLHQSEGIYSISTVLNLCVKKSTIGGDNVTMLKLWLSRNNVKVVYPLATPVTIQLKNLWLSMPPTSYYTKTIIIDSTTGNISLKPIFTATVATTALEEVVSNLETQNEQLEQENIATMLALTDMYEMMSMSMPMTMYLGDDEEIEVTEVSSIGMVYAKLINKGLKTIDQVPYFLQAEVKYALSQM